MTEWNRGDAEMAIALKRAELNRALHYKHKYDAEKHNLCLALVLFKDGTFDVLAAYSNDSAIPESIRLGLNLIPDMYAALPKMERFGCNGMAQFHTEPKLLNYLCANPFLRQSTFHGPLPRNSFYQSVLAGQRERAARQAQLLRRPEDISSITLVTEIDCCPTCTAYSLHTIELGKKVGEKGPTQLKEVQVTTKQN